MIPVRIGTRGSALALYQAHTVAARITAAVGRPCTVVVIKTSGDRLSTADLSAVGGKRLFVKEIEEALLSDEIDVAVHSSKDMPAEQETGLLIAATLPREDPRDAVVLPGSPERCSVEALKVSLGHRPRIGTGSVRRVAQLLRLFDGASFHPVRGNVDTRLHKLDVGGFDAIVLAAAGLVRLGFNARISTLLPVDACVPAPGQGIIAVETRNDDMIRHQVGLIDDLHSHAALDAERALVLALGGGCQMPIGAHATVEQSHISIHGVVVSPDGSRVVRRHAIGPVSDAGSVGARCAAALLEDGAGEILDESVRQQRATGES